MCENNKGESSERSSSQKKRHKKKVEGILHDVKEFRKKAMSKMSKRLNDKQRDKVKRSGGKNESESSSIRIRNMPKVYSKEIKDALKIILKIVPAMVFIALVYDLIFGSDMTDNTDYVGEMLETYKESRRGKPDTGRVKNVQAKGFLILNETKVPFLMVADYPNRIWLRTKDGTTITYNPKELWKKSRSVSFKVQEVEMPWKEKAFYEAFCFPFSPFDQMLSHPGSWSFDGFGDSDGIFCYKLTKTVESEDISHSTFVGFRDPKRFRVIAAKGDDTAHITFSDYMDSSDYDFARRAVMDTGIAEENMRAYIESITIKLSKTVEVEVKAE